MIQLEKDPQQQDFIIKNCSLSIDNDGVVQAVYTADVEDNSALSLSNSSLLNTMSQGRPFPLLLDLRSVRTLTRALHNYFSVDTAVNQYAAVALVVASPIGRILADVFIALYRPVLPVEVFTRYEDALVWLRSF
jgi:hypothetical protein